jgi:hypothetical protein
MKPIEDQGTEPMPDPKEYTGQPHPLPNWKPEWSQKFGDLIADFNQHFYYEIVAEDEPEITACFLQNYFQGDAEKLGVVISHLKQRLASGDRY